MGGEPEDDLDGSHRLAASASGVTPGRHVPEDEPVPNTGTPAVDPGAVAAPIQACRIAVVATSEPDGRSGDDGGGAARIADPRTRVAAGALYTLYRL